jgi:hypothetical protein
MADFLDGHARVMAVVRAAHKERTGNERGADSWLAGKLGVSRQSVDNWSKRKGFPRKYAAKLVKITGLTEDDIWPGTRATVDFPTEIWDTVTKRARRAGRSPPEIVVELVRIGLNSSEGN